MINFKKNILPAGFTLIEIMIVVSIIAILAAITIPGLLRARINSNEALTCNNLRALSTASETYSAVNGYYPLNITSLSSATPPYVNSNFCGSTVGGYTYSCTFSTRGYTVQADPSAIHITGEKTFTIITGGILNP
jgi:prepilin-type N-terminal cleavage/methylation domain-containing protein